MKTLIAWLVPIMSLAVAAVIYLDYQQGNEAVRQEDVPGKADRVPDSSKKPEIRYPLPEPETPVSDGTHESEQSGQDSKQSAVQAAEESVPLPELDNSDKLLGETLRSLAGGGGQDELFSITNIVRRFVVTVDNVPYKQLPLKYLPVKLPEGRFLVTKEAGSKVISQENYQRYEPYVRLIEAVDINRLASAYISLYPLFQSAFDELGYPAAYFNDRLVEAIDLLLETPEIKGPVKLVRPKVLYKFADPELEALSAGQKLLIRTGPQNNARIKSRLMEFRRILIEQGNDT